MPTSQSPPVALTQESPYEDIMEHHPLGRETGNTFGNTMGTAEAWDNNDGRTALALEAIEPSYEELGERPVEVPTVYDRVRHGKL